MTRFLIFVLIVMIAGCSAPPKIEAPKVTESVTPLPLTINPIEARSQGRSLAQVLLNHYQEGPAYSLSVPVALAGYLPENTLTSPDGRQLLQVFRTGSRWGFVSVVTGSRPVVNAFSLVRQQGQGYALVLRGMRICLVAGASRAPFWGGSSWVHSTVNPGTFECSGQTRGSEFTPGSGLPGALDIYYTEGDTVLYDSDLNRLQTIVNLLAQQFSNLRVPRVN